VKERGILFKGELVRAILAGKKTQTRRLVRPQPESVDLVRHVTVPFSGSPKMLQGSLRCPYGVPGDRLWVRETWQAIHVSIDYDTGYGDDLCAAEKIPLTSESGYWSPVYAATDPQADMLREDRGFSWRPALHMPRWASRITLEITDVRVQRLQEITEEDARAEGLPSIFERFPHMGREQRLTSGERAADAPHRAAFAVLWDEINGDRALWLSNPWTWAITFRRLG
jgi:hypothetical protein